MRVYRTLYRYIDLDQIQSITEPHRDESACGMYFTFYVTLMFQEKPLRISLPVEMTIGNDYKGTYKTETINKVFREVTEAHEDLLNAWKGITVTVTDITK